MNSKELDVKQIYEMAWKVLDKLGKAQVNVEGAWGFEYTDEHIHICHLDGYVSDSFRVYQKQEGRFIRVLERHIVYREITDKMDLLRDMLHHGFCDEECPGFNGAVAKRAYEIYQRRDYEPGHELDDWLLAEAEILEELRLKFYGDWEVAVLRSEPSDVSKRDRISEPWGPTHCVILRRGEWVNHLKSLASTL